MKEHELTNTWTHIGLAAERVLTQVNKLKDEMPREDQESDREKNAAEHNRQRTTRDAVLIENKRASR